MRAVRINLRPFPKTPRVLASAPESTIRLYTAITSGMLQAATDFNDAMDEATCPRDVMLARFQMRETIQHIRAALFRQMRMYQSSGDPRHVSLTSFASSLYKAVEDSFYPFVVGRDDVLWKDELASREASKRMLDEVLSKCSKR